MLAKQSAATDADFERVQGVIGHEYFHNWTGNRVTCRDWFQLTLKEGLTVYRDSCFSADMTSEAVKRIEDVRVMRSHQFVEDAGPMACAAHAAPRTQAAPIHSPLRTPLRAVSVTQPRTPPRACGEMADEAAALRACRHPIRPESYIAIDNFYTVTVYEKGCEVIRMYQTLLGKAGFRKGMDLCAACLRRTAATHRHHLHSPAHHLPLHLLHRLLHRLRHLLYHLAGTSSGTMARRSRATTSARRWPTPTGATSRSSSAGTRRRAAYHPLLRQPHLLLHHHRHHLLLHLRHHHLQAGTPTVKAVGSYDAASKKYTLELSQSTPATPGQPTKLPFHIPVKVALLDAKGACLLPERVRLAGGTSRRPHIGGRLLLTPERLPSGLESLRSRLWSSPQAAPRTTAAHFVAARCLS